MLRTQITSELDKRKFYSYLKDCNEKNHPNPNEIAYIVQKLDLHNISQLIFDFGEKNVGCMLRYFEEQEQYEYCAIIRDKIEIHNKALKTDIKL